MGFVTSISIKLLENFVDFIAKKIEEYFIPRIQEHVGYLGLTAASALLLLFIVVNFFGWKLRGNLVNSILEKIGEYCVPQIIREQVGYLTDYDSNMKTLKEEVEKLDGIQNKMRDSVNEAIKNGQRIGPGVDSRLTVLKRINKEVEQFLKDEARVNKRWLCGLCPDLISRYKLSWEAKKKMQDVIELQKDNTTRLVVVDFETRIKIMDEIMAALKDDNINVIGICGLGGMGKTTTVKKIDKRAKVEKLFDVTVMAVVSQTPDLKNIQNEIADKLGLTFEQKSLSGRADRLRERLMDCKRVLVILDDVWARLDLEEVGIPFGDDQKSCKVMLTSRSLDVCKEMRTCKDFTIGVLSKSEAWNLFRQMAGNSIESHELHSIAQEVVNECGGLPLAIVTVGRALENEDGYMWKDALQLLRIANPYNVPDFLREVYGKLELSYNFLRNQEAQSLLLLCCVFKEDTYIPIKDLIRYGMGLILFKGINDELAKATNRVRALVNKLTRCNLLLDIGNEKCVKMHDVVRDFIRFKAIEGNHELKELATEGTDANCASVSLIFNKVHDLLLVEFIPKKIILFIPYHLGHSQKIPDILQFEGMKELKVLQLNGIFIPSSAPPLSFLTKLRTLCLHGCNLESISAIGELQTLIILSFCGSNIRELPQEIGRLTHLLLLDLSYCVGLLIISPGVISSLIRLEELYMRGISSQWVVEGEGGAQKRANLSELVSLSNLITLETSLPRGKFPDIFILFEKLVRFWIGTDGAKWCSLDGFNGMGRLNLRRAKKTNIELRNELEVDLDAKILVDSRFLALLKKTDCLKLRVGGGMNVLNAQTQGSFVQLKALHLYSSGDVEYLVDTGDLVPHSVFPILESLMISRVKKLKMICHGQLPARSFVELRSLKLMDLPDMTHLWKGPTQPVSLGNLRSVQLSGCNRLKNLFSQSIATSLLQLEDLDISFCKEMEEIVASTEREHGKEINKIGFPKLSELTLVEIPNLFDFCRKMDEIEFPQLSTLYLKNLSELRTICPNSQASEGNQNTATQHLFNEKVKSLCKLRYTDVNGCKNLLNVFSSNLVQSLQNLEELRVQKCDLLEVVFDFEGVNIEEGDRVLLPNLNILNLKDLLELKHLFNEKVLFPSLEKLILFQGLISVRVEYCNKLLHVFPFNLLQSFGNLEELTVLSCASLVEVFEVEGLNVEEGDRVLLPNLKKLNLKDLPELKNLFNEKVLFPSLEKLILFQGLKSVTVECCNKLLHVFPSNLLQSLGNLEELTILSCASLVEVFEEEGLNVEEGDRVLLPNLKKLNLKDLPGLKHLFNEKVLFPSLEKLILFQGLISVRVECCNKLLHVFPLNLLQSFENLEELTVLSCASLVEVFEVEGLNVEERDKVLLPNLKKLNLKDLLELKHLFNEKVLFPSLEKLILFQGLISVRVECCNKLLHVFPFNLLQSFGNLKVLTVLSCASLVEVFEVEGLNVEEGDRVLLPNLKKLNLKDLPELKHLFNEKVLFPSLKKLILFQGLISVRVECCNKFLHVFPFNLLQSFGNLEELTVLSCASLVEVFEVEGLNVEEGDRVLLPNLKKLNLKDLLELKHLFNEKVLFPSLEKLILFQGLKSMRVECCNKLLHVVPSNLLQSLGNLEELTVLSCAALVEVFELEGLNVEERDTVLLPKLKKFHLKDLNVKVLFPSLEKVILFQSLKSVRIERCSSLRNLFYPLMARSLVRLEELVIEHCNMMEEIISKGEEEEEEEERMNTITVIPQLKHLGLYLLPNLVSFYQGRYAFDLPSLVDVFVFDCPKMKTFTSEFVSTKGLKQVHNCRWLPPWRGNIRQSSWMGDLNNTIQQLFQRKQITFPSLEVLEIVDEDNVERILKGILPVDPLCKLRQIYVFKCNKLSNAVPSNLLSALQNLEELSIEQCDSLVEVFEVDGLNVEEGDRVLLPNLKKLIFQDLPKLKHIVKREPKGFLFFQRLEVLQVWRCNNLRNLFSPSMVKSVEQLQELQISECWMITEIIAEDEGEGDEKAMDKIEFPQLHRLTLWNLPNLVSFSPQVNTTAINVDFEGILLKFNLHTQIRHLFNEKVAFPRLEELVLTDVSEINEIWCKMDHKGTIGFQYLKSVRVSYCGNLRNVFYPSMARGLVHLEDLSIYSCKMMEEIVVKGENEEEDRTDKIVIPQLEKLELSDLPRLKSFYQGLYPFDLPSLMHVSIDQCPEMTTFSLDSPITPKLQKVDKGYYSGKSFWMGDLNKTIQQLFARKELEVNQEIAQEEHFDTEHFDTDSNDFNSDIDFVAHSSDFEEDWI